MNELRLLETELEGVFVIENYHTKDLRGNLTKTYHEDFFRENGLCTDFKESYYSISRANVIRGMHFQLPPYAHEKLVYVVDGEIIDVVLDLRKDSTTFGKYIEVVLNSRYQKSIYIPKGLAHGFCANKDRSITVYSVSTVYNRGFDSGVRYDSFGFPWDIVNPIVSERDRALTSFEAFQERNPF